MTRRPRGPVAQIAAALSGRGRRGHSELYWWMWDHYDQLQGERERQGRGRADWVTATEQFMQLGLTGRDSAPLKPENVRKTWERVVRDKGVQPTQKHAVAVSRPAAKAAKPVPPPDDDDGDLPPRHTFTPARIR